MTLPGDSHVHTEWSWDAPLGDMEQTCARAVRIGLPAVAFTEHFDHTVWRVDLAGPYASEHLRSVADPDGVLTPPVFDAEGYLAAVERCRSLFPGLRILSGAEVGEPHWHAEACRRVLDAGRFDRVLGSLHCMPQGDGYAEPFDVLRHREPHEVVRDYLTEVLVLITSSDLFEVLAHIDYPVRFWPAERPFEPEDFEEEFRGALRALARSGRALEVNTRLPLHDTILRWWREAGGREVTFGSDAHQPGAVGDGFADAARMAEAHGFRGGDFPYDVWRR